MKIHKILFFTALAFGNQVISQPPYFPPIDSDEWETASPESLGWCTDEIPALLNYLDENDTKGFIVLKEGKMVIEHYFDDFTVDNYWYWASAGKTITALLVGIAQEEEFLSISDASTDYLGEGWTDMTPEQEGAITIWNQLTMTSGLDDSGDIFCTDPECLTYLADPATRWAYHNGPYTLLDDVIANATGMTLNAYCNTRLEAHTGMSGGFLPVDFNNVYYSKPRDFARFGLLIENNGNWDGTEVLSDMTYFEDMINTSQSLNKSYGYLWWLNGKESFMLPGLETVFSGSAMSAAPDDMIAALGKNGQIIDVVPSMDMVVIRFGNVPTGLESLVPTLLNNTIWEYLNTIMCEPSSVSENLDEHFLHYDGTNETIYLNQNIKELSIYSLSGQLNFNIVPTGISSLDVSFLESGIHLIHAETDHGVIRQKIITH